MINGAVTFDVDVRFKSHLPTTPELSEQTAVVGSRGDSALRPFNVRSGAPSPVAARATNLNDAPFLRRFMYQRALPFGLAQDDPDPRGRFRGRPDFTD